MTRFSVILRVTLMLVFMGIGGAWAEESRFFSALNDVPVMPGLYELTAETVVFDMPEGRIVEASAVSETENINKIKAFYADTLPQLGWRAVPAQGKGNAYVREGEKLVFRIETRRQLNIIHFSLSPQP